MNWGNKSVLVTGAGGFIGSHLTEKLIEFGANVRALIKYNSRGDYGNLKFIDHAIIKETEIIQANICDEDAVNKAMKGIDYVFHLGALISIPYSYNYPKDVIYTNILGTLNILQAALINEPSKIVHTSTSEIYGTAQYVPIDEKHPNQVQSPYAASKLAADKLAESYYRSFNLPITILRPFNTYGPRQSERAIIPTIISQALTKEKISLGSLEPIRDFIFVSDTVNGFIKAADSNLSVGKEINVGSGEPIKIKELVNLISLLLDSPIQIEIDNKRIRPQNSEVMELHCCNKLAKELIGWEPKIKLQKGLITTINWIKKHLNMYDADSYSI